MTAPLYEVGAFGEGGGLTAALLLGLAFGWFLERGGLGDATKLAGQFYLTDFTVFKVMFSAILTAMLGALTLSELGVLSLPLVFVPETFLLPQALGGTIFGIGFVTGGLCPGTSCVSASTGRLDGLAVVAGMLFGVFVFNEIYPLVQPLYDATPMGVATLPDVTGLAFGTVAAGVTAAALAGFWAAERLERRAVT